MTAAVTSPAGVEGAAAQVPRSVTGAPSKDVAPEAAASAGVVASDAALVVRRFRPGTSDDAGAKALEARASQHGHNPVLATLLKVHHRHLLEFDAKARSYDDSLVLLAVDAAVTAVASRTGDAAASARTPLAEASSSSSASDGDGSETDPDAPPGDDGLVCGGICVGIKKVWLQGKLRKVGYLFDLRVREDYQRRRIGTMLNTAAEAEATARGVDAIYLTVNQTNQKARRFYEKHGYALGSERALMFRPLIMAGTVSGGADMARAAAKVPGASIRRVSAEEFAVIADRAYGGEPTETAPGRAGRDLALAGGFEALRKACPEKFLDAWVAEEASSSSLAALVLWDGDGTTSIQVEKVIFTPATWRHPLTQLLPLSLGCVGVAMWAQQVYVSAPSVLSIVSGCALAATIAVAVGLAATVRFLLGRRRERARLVAPVAEGPRGAELLRALAGQAQATAKALGFGISIVNLDIEDPKTLAFQAGKQSPKTLFMYKMLCSGGADEATTPPPFSADNFFDPRDLS